MGILTLALILGTRPQMIKSAPFIHLANKDMETTLEIIHTGQHYDHEMTKIFFEELGARPRAVQNVNVGGIIARVTYYNLIKKAISKKEFETLQKKYHDCFK